MEPLAELDVQRPLGRKRPRGSDRIDLDVGGTRFSTSRATLEASSSYCWNQPWRKLRPPSFASLIGAERRVEPEASGGLRVTMYE